MGLLTVSHLWIKQIAKLPCELLGRGVEYGYKNRQKFRSGVSLDIGMSNFCNISAWHLLHARKYLGFTSSLEYISYIDRETLTLTQRRVSTERPV